MIDFTKKKLIVIKIGSNILTDESNKLDLNTLRHLVSQIAFLKNQGKRVVIVTSGAIVCGGEALKIKPESIADKQAAAAVGQVILMENYQQFFVRHGFTIGQVLLTRDAFMDKERAKHAKNTFQHLLDLDVIPIVNENDTISVDEIKFSDNDNLSCTVSLLLGAGLQIFLTDIDGLYDLDPRAHKDARLITKLTEISDDLLASLSANASRKGRGGMKSKVNSAKQLLENGIEVIIANGRKENILKDLYHGKMYGTFCIKGKKC
ncbi:MAG: glutamate 5-kinase [Candidatus Margulisbacteria bacterium]|nr:glutamate 5-kinase [Candidatus Margulisiibacteriota bacterium]